MESHLMHRIFSFINSSHLKKVCSQIQVPKSRCTQSASQSILNLRKRQVERVQTSLSLAVKATNMNVTRSWHVSLKTNVLFTHTL